MHHTLRSLSKDASPVFLDGLPDPTVNIEANTFNLSLACGYYGPNSITSCSRPIISLYVTLPLMLPLNSILRVLQRSPLLVSTESCL